MDSDLEEIVIETPRDTIRGALRNAAQSIRKVVSLAKGSPEKAQTQKKQRSIQQLLTGALRFQKPPEAHVAPDQTAGTLLFQEFSVIKNSFECQYTVGSLCTLQILEGLYI